MSTIYRYLDVLSVEKCIDNINDFIKKTHIYHNVRYVIFFLLSFASSKLKKNNMGKIVFHSLTEEDFELLTNLAVYLLSLKYKEIGIFSVPVCPVAFSPADMELFCKLKHSHVLLYDKK